VSVIRGLTLFWLLTAPICDEAAHLGPMPLEENATREQRARRRLALCEWRSTPGEAGLADRASLSEILSRPELQNRRDSSAIWRRIGIWITEFFDELFSSHGMRSFAFGTRFLVLALATALAAFGLLRLLGRRRRPLSRRASPARPQNAPL